MKTAEEILNEKNLDMVCIPPATTIHEALEKMLSLKIGAIVIKEENKIVGIWTERDLMKNVVSPGFDAKKEKIGDHMSTNLVTASCKDTVYNLKDKFLGRRVRHLFVEKDGQYIGLLSTGDVTRASLEEKNEELSDLSTIVNWEYYEDWKWKKKN